MRKLESAVDDVIERAECGIYVDSPQQADRGLW